jgi:hypothetical protein
MHLHPGGEWNPRSPVPNAKMLTTSPRRHDSVNIVSIFILKIDVFSQIACRYAEKSDNKIVVFFKKTENRRS